jgi:hypothetical protein
MEEKVTRVLEAKISDTLSFCSPEYFLRAQVISVLNKVPCHVDTPIA